MIKARSTGSIRLNLGCFDQPLRGWINTDITPHIFIARVPGLPSVLSKLGLLSKSRLEQHRNGIFRRVRCLNVTKRFPYDDGSVECVHSSHMLEHLYRDQALFCLREIHRVLVAGGCVRISVPDMDVVVRDYDPENPDEFVKTVFESHEKREKNQHHWFYNEHSLRAILQEAGFEEIFRCQFHQGHCPDVEQIDCRAESLFMEAVK